MLPTLGSYTAGNSVCNATNVQAIKSKRILGLWHCWQLCRRLAGGNCAFRVQDRIGLLQKLKHNICVFYVYTRYEYIVPMELFHFSLFKHTVRIFAILPSSIYFDIILFLLWQLVSVTLPSAEYCPPPLLLKSTLTSPNPSSVREVKLLIPD